MTSKSNGHASGRHRPSVLKRSEPRMHPITFCTECEEAIPANAITCFRCGCRQPHGERSLQVIFCRKCGQDYPAKALACFHCGNINPHHPYLRGHIAS